VQGDGGAPVSSIVIWPASGVAFERPLIAGNPFFEEVTVKVLRALGAFSLLAACAAVAYAETVESVEYKRWSECKAGSWVTFNATVTDAEGKKREFELTNKLVEITPEKIVIETTETEGGKAKTPSKKDHAAKVEKKAESPGERKDGEEEIEVAGKKLKCKWESYKSEGKGDVVEVKDWFNDEVPGKMVRHEIKKSGPKGFTHLLVAAKWEKEKEKEKK
jgi:hypothetical protein